MICITLQRTLDHPLTCSLIQVAPTAILIRALQSKRPSLGVSCIPDKDLPKHHTCGPFLFVSQTTHLSRRTNLGSTLGLFPSLRSDCDVAARIRRAQNPQINAKPRNKAATASSGVSWTCSDQCALHFRASRTLIDMVVGIHSTLESFCAALRGACYFLPQPAAVNNPI